jgi:hypothetical protein
MHSVQCFQLKRIWQKIKYMNGHCIYQRISISSLYLEKYKLRPLSLSDCNDTVIEPHSTYLYDIIHVCLFYNIVYVCVWWWLKRNKHFFPFIYTPSFPWFFHLYQSFIAPSNSKERAIAYPSANMVTRQFHIMIESTKHRFHTLEYGKWDTFYDCFFRDCIVSCHKNKVTNAQRCCLIS